MTRWDKMQADFWEKFPPWLIWGGVLVVAWLVA